MTDKEYVRRFRAAVALFMENPELYMGEAGLCYGLSHASQCLEERNRISFYPWIAKFMGGVGDSIGSRGKMVPVRIDMVLLMSNLDAATIINIRDSEYPK